MHSVLTRLNALAAYTMSVLAGLTFLCFLSTFLFVDYQGLTTYCDGFYKDLCHFNDNLFNICKSMKKHSIDCAPIYRLPPKPTSTR